jgi:methylisocitrate lyase
MWAVEHDGNGRVCPKDRRCDTAVFADGDNGRGNGTNMIRTMNEFEKAGVAAMFFEDQVSAKRCGHMSGTQVIRCEEMGAKN